MSGVVCYTIPFLGESTQRTIRRVSSTRRPYRVSIETFLRIGLLA